MSAFNSNQKEADYPIINVDAENEHFELSDSIISWIESFKNSSTNETHLADPNVITETLRNILPPPLLHHQSSAIGMSWNLLRMFDKKQGTLRNLLTTEFNALEEDSSKPSSSTAFQHINLIRKVPSPQTKYNIDDDNSSDYWASILPEVNMNYKDQAPYVRMRGNDEWAPPRAQIIFNIHEETNFRKLMQRQNYRCAGCGTKIDLELARRLVLYCHYLGKYFCKCCFSHKAIHLPGYILQKWDFHKYQVSHFALQLLDRIANEPLFNINDVNSSLYRKIKKLRHLIDIRMQLYYLKIYITTCTQTDKLNGEYSSFTHQHLLQDDVHLYSLNNLIEIQHGKLYEYLNDLVTRSIAHIAQCDRCRAKGHYCQLCGPSSLMSSMILSSGQSGDQQQQQQQQLHNQSFKLKHSNSIGQNIAALNNQVAKIAVQDQTPYRQASHSRSSSGNYSNFTLSNSGISFNAPPGGGQGSAAAVAIAHSPPSTMNTSDYELIFPFEIGRVAQCRVCGCCFHLQCFIDADQNCPKCERIQRRRAETDVSVGGTSPSTTTTATTATTNSVDSPPTTIAASS